jgi:hypothetical protein
VEDRDTIYSAYKEGARAHLWQYRQGETQCRVIDWWLENASVNTNANPDWVGNIGVLGGKAFIRSEATRAWYKSVYGYLCKWTDGYRMGNCGKMNVR